MLIVCCCVGMLPTTSVGADSYALDPSHTAIVFSVGHLGFSYTYGRFNVANGEFVLDGANSKFAFKIDVNSLDTNNEKRDEHLRSAEFFDVANHPAISFQSTLVEETSDGYTITGNLTMHGVTRQVRLPIKKLGEGAGPYGKYRVGFMSQFQVKRSDFGVSGMLGPIGDEVALSVSFEGIRQ